MKKIFTKPSNESQILVIRGLIVYLYGINEILCVLCICAKQIYIEICSISVTTL